WRAHRLELPGAGAQAIEAFPNLSAYEKSSMPSAIRFRAGECHFQKNGGRDATNLIMVLKTAAAFCYLNPFVRGGFEPLDGARQSKRRRLGAPASLTMNEVCYDPWLQ